jgi:hypothetical protein
MKKGSHQKEIPIEDFEENEEPVKKEKTTFFDEDDKSIAQK